MNKKSIKRIIFIVIMYFSCNIIHSQTDLTINKLFDNYKLLNQVKNIQLSEGMKLNKSTFEAHSIIYPYSPEIILLNSDLSDSLHCKAKLIYSKGIESPSVFFIQYEPNIYIGSLRSVISPNENQFFLYVNNSSPTIALLFDFGVDYEFKSIMDIPILNIYVYINNYLKGDFIFINKECNHAISFKHDNFQEGLLKKEEFGKLNLSNDIQVFDLIKQFRLINYENVINWNNNHSFKLQRVNLFEKPYSKYKIEDTILLETE